MQTVKLNLDWTRDERFNSDISYTKNYRRIHPELTKYPERYQLVSTYFQLGNRNKKVDFKPQSNGTIKVVYKYPAKIEKVLILTKEKARELYRQLKTSGFYTKEFQIECYKIK